MVLYLKSFAIGLTSCGGVLPTFQGVPQTAKQDSIGQRMNRNMHNAQIPKKFRRGIKPFPHPTSSTQLSSLGALFFSMASHP
ncbi:hypothetical protein VTL71DRAFT_13907 [Oculimacula yallundae]|uniref:Uncharacterized protein n=1 Tax=Oculimacula yallundae TaxID=86028 RepID=A0ABR4CNB0_9HELO